MVNLQLIRQICFYMIGPLSRLKILIQLNRQISSTPFGRIQLDFEQDRRTEQELDRDFAFLKPLLSNLLSYTLL